MLAVDSILQNVFAEAEKIQSIPAPTFFEFERAAYIHNRFVEIGLSEVTTDRVGNVIGYVMGRDLNQKPIVISAHTDTVHAVTVNHELVKQQDLWIGAGIGDNTISVAALIGFGAYFRNHQLSRTLILCANTCEEGLGNLAGIRAVVDQFQDRPLFYLVLEGMGLGVIFHRGLGVKRYEITITTNGGHSWGNFGEPSAIHEIAQLIQAFGLTDTPKSIRSSYNFGTIMGGTTVNSIAHTARTALDLRSEDQSVLELLEKRLFLLKGKIESPKVKIQIHRIGERPYGALQKNHWLVKSAENSLMKLEIVPRLAIGSTDANYPLSLGYPAICVALTTGGNVHTPDEYIYLEPLKKGILQVLQLIQAG